MGKDGYEGCASCGNRVLKRTGRHRDAYYDSGGITLLHIASEILLAVFAVFGIWQLLRNLLNRE